MKRKGGRSALDSYCKFKALFWKKRDFGKDERRINNFLDDFQ